MAGGPERSFDRTYLRGARTRARKRCPPRIYTVICAMPFQFTFQLLTKVPMCQGCFQVQNRVAEQKSDYFKSGKSYIEEMKINLSRDATRGKLPELKHQIKIGRVLAATLLAVARVRIRDRRVTLRFHAS